MRLLHMDCFSGLAGDMFVGACLDLGLPFEIVAEAVRALDIKGVGVEAMAARRGGLVGTRFRVLLDGCSLEGPDPGEVDSATICRSPLAAADDASGIGLAELRGALASEALPPRVGVRARGLLDRLALAEAAVTGLDGSQLTWKRHAALDLLVDLVGAAAAVVWLEPDRITCGPVFVGGEAGPVGNREPVLGATTARLLSGVPIVGGPGGELLTPTGAVLLAGLVDEFGHLPQMVVERCGYGLGRAEVAGRANAVRIWLGRANDLPLSDPTGAVGSSGGEEPCPG